MIRTEKAPGAGTRIRDSPATSVSGTLQASRGQCFYVRPYIRRSRPDGLWSCPGSRAATVDRGQAGGEHKRGLPDQFHRGKADDGFAGATWKHDHSTAPDFGTGPVE